MGGDWVEAQAWHLRSFKSERMGEGSQGSLVLQARTVQGQDFVPNLVENGDQFDHYPACGYYCDFCMKDLCLSAFMRR